MGDDLELIKAAQRGDVAARNQIVLLNIRLVYRVANSLGYRGADRDDARQAGTIGLMRAIGTFDPKNGGKFSAWAGLRIAAEIIAVGRLERRHAQRVDRYRAIFGPSHVTDAEDPATSAGSRVDAEKLRSVLNRMRRRMPTEVAILELIVGIDRRGPLEYTRVATVFGVSRTYVCVSANRAFRTLLGLMGEPLDRRVTGKPARAVGR